jgi:ABC transporter substrate binding protein
MMAVAIDPNSELPIAMQQSRQCLAQRGLIVWHHQGRRGGATKSRSSSRLISYGPDQVEQFRRGAGYVDRILKGEKPANLPVRAPTKYELFINLKTAKTLGLTIPPAVLSGADEVIE